MKIYTKTGDKGETGLYGGTRVSKASARVESYGAIDELNAFLGMAKSRLSDEELNRQLQKIQFDLFTLGSESATPLDKLVLANGRSRLPLTISETEIRMLEEWMDAMDAKLPKLQYFILPGGGEVSSVIHVARTVCRRAERAMVALGEIEEVRPELLKYLNRLSDYLFVLARYTAHLEGEAETYWIPNPKH
ncbi:cob(I)yrinic acid a,c-diamide adenosyltransferase [Bergeyella sp. RCAD1439]|uniref:cob(I)yrinic acid a,c-diamide adenosyltransferase n=1 Tax=Bergeyella anatis TaxID=3113737 RepID=UPI002E18E8B5|nr:cob(I)yrinic acid a,c-diamide adenosyltransferase [Bergeyella sp. RCAD1439]